jgi:hypothetical protein
VLVNQLHPSVPAARGAEGPGVALLRFLGDRDARGLAAFRHRLGGAHPLAELPLRGTPPTDLAGLETLGAEVLARLGA